MEWTGINNENEYYSAYFLSEGLADSLKDQFDAWAKLESENKAKAEDAGEKDWQHAPNRALRMNARALLDELNDAFAESSVCRGGALLPRPSADVWSSTSRKHRRLRSSTVTTTCRFPCFARYTVKARPPSRTFGFLRPCLTAGPSTLTTNSTRLRCMSPDPSSKTCPDSTAR